MNYFISDTHFYHYQLLEPNDFAPRHFKNGAAMNQQMIDAWNARVEDKDTVYHLGDISMRPQDTPTDEETYDILKQLKGHMILIKGNHDYRSLFKFLDHHNETMEDGLPRFRFEDVGALLKFDHMQFYCTHYPMLLGKVQQILNLHGHIHHYSVPVAENINIGVDAPEREYLSEDLPWGSPLRGEEIIEMYEKKKIVLAKTQGK
ncbi:metallophosphoesterase [Companilactobacillus mishanensis]|uniref:Metallophosphatase n=1 Tax=Companilactobacillus mishanensis TaxID=2486008 RepID=A0ABW9P6A7_9LACO|nr:metallophosphoesterase [Companilactobacillus mishanensis]MQS44765.1 metallophosphatase [Companilactobacillus mishanensis]MQS89282.1 metallophosphatase [Companilactobacillus mishanensis]